MQSGIMKSNPQKLPENINTQHEHSETITLITSKASFRTACALSLITISLFCCSIELSAEAPVDENALQVFVTATLHDHVRVLVHKESHQSTSKKTYVSAILCRMSDGINVLLIAEMRHHHFRELWSSLSTVKSLGVVSPRNLEYVITKEGEYFTFWGCSPHDCGGISGTYTFEIFDASNRSMQVLDVRLCTIENTSSDPSRVRMCVTNLIDEDGQISAATRIVINKQIQSNIAGAADIPIEY